MQRHPSVFGALHTVAISPGGFAAARRDPSRRKQPSRPKLIPDLRTQLTELADQLSLLLEE
jgi:hypothetical protein